MTVRISLGVGVADWFSQEADTEWRSAHRSLLDCFCDHLLEKEREGSRVWNKETLGCDGVSV